MKQVLFDAKVKGFGVIKIDSEQRYVKLLLNHLDIDGAKLLQAVNYVGRHIRLTNRQNAIYIIIDKNKCENWKEDVIKLINEYNN